MFKRIGLVLALMIGGAATGLIVSKLIGGGPTDSVYIDNVSLQALPNVPDKAPFSAPVVPTVAGANGAVVDGVTTVTLPIPDAPPGPKAKDPKAKIGMVSIPKIMVQSTVWYGVTDKTLERGVGWWPGTARPGGIGNVVLSGHRTTFQQPFRYLDRLSPGDIVDVTTEVGTFRYVVTGSEVVEPTAVRIVAQTPERTLTLFTCTPIGLDTQRLVVHARFEGQV